MLRHLLVIAVALGLAGPASAAVMVDPTDPANNSKTVFTAENFTGTGLMGEFTLVSNATVTASVSGSGFPISMSLFEITDDGGAQIATQSFLVDGTSFAVAAIEDVFLGAGTYSLGVTGSFSNAAVSADLAAVPLPGAVLLLGSAIAGLGLYRRRVQQTAA